MVPAESLTDQLHDKVRALLTRGQVDCFIGYKQGSSPLRVTPCVVRDAAEVTRLVWNEACINNLVPQLHKYPRQKVGIMVKGCDGRALIELIKLHQVRREDLYIIGVSCTGILDPQKVVAYHPSAPVTRVDVQGDQVTLAAGADQVVAGKDGLLFDKCRHCTQPTPTLYDEVLGLEMIPAFVDPDERYADVIDLEQRDAAGRLAFWSEQLSKCTLCYACQTVCPSCFCKECSVTLARSDPKRKNPGLEHIFTFHILRAYHMIGRCTGCYECERVCPVDIPLSTIFKKVEKDCRELFDYRAGVDLDSMPPLSSSGDRESDV